MAVKQRKDKQGKKGKTWYYDFQIRGVRYRAAIPEAKNKAQAERAEARIRLAIYESKFGDGIEKNFAAFVKEEYIPWAMENKRSYYTAEHHMLDRLMAYFGKYDLSEISPLLVEKFKRERAAEPVIGGRQRKPSSINRELACLSRIFSMACDNGLVSQNPCSKVRRLREDNARTRYLSGEEEARLMAALTGRFDRIRPLVVIALNTGMRLGEILGLTWPQVDWERNLIKVVRTKNGHDRTIPMNAAVRDLLLDRWREADKSRANIFQESGKAITLSFPRVVKRAKLADFKFHDLRHTFATRLAAAGTDAFTLAALLGHRTLAMTSRYTHPTDENKRRAIAVLEESRHNGVTIDIRTRTEITG